MEKQHRQYRAAFELLELASYFLRLGFLGFGGPLALIAAFQRDWVQRKKWISAERFNQALSLIKALPGPTATQVALYLGQAKCGRAGGFIAGFFLILPSFLMMILLAVTYQSVLALQWSKPLFAGMQAAALGVIAESVWKIATPYRKQLAFWCVLVAGGILMTFHPQLEPIIIFGAGLMGVGLNYASQRFVISLLGFEILLGSSLVAAKVIKLGYATAKSPQMLKLVWVFFKAGAFVFGTGLAIVPLLAHDVVEKMKWLSYPEFMDALAFGQITPGPVVITATFIGFRVAGLIGALIATAAIFGPAFFNILTWFPIVESRLAQTRYAKIFVQWSIAAVAGSILVTIVKLGISAQATNLVTHVGTSWILPMISLLALILSLTSRIAAWMVIPLGGLLQALLMSWIRTT